MAETIKNGPKGISFDAFLLEVIVYRIPSRLAQSNKGVIYDNPSQAPNVAVSFASPNPIPSRFLTIK